VAAYQPAAAEAAAEVVAEVEEVVFHHQAVEMAPFGVKCHRQPIKRKQLKEHKRF